MIYLLFGEDSLAKDKRVAEIKQKTLGQKDASLIDFEVLHAHKLKAADLKKSLISLPAIAKRRLVILRAINKLDKYNKELILSFLSEEQRHLDIVLDFDGSDERNKFLSQLMKLAKCERFGISRTITAFDLGDMIFKRQEVMAVKMLAELLEKGEAPVNLIGGLLWKWSKMKRSISKENYKKGLLEFQEADLNIKRTRLRPEYAMEILVISLSQLIA